MNLEFAVETDPIAQDIETLSKGLNQHALPKTGTAGFAPIAVFARDEDGLIRGGAAGKINWNWLHVSLLWVDESMRHGGLGSRLLRMLESAAKEQGCRESHLDTFSYQAAPFYEREGYSEFARLHDYPDGHDRIFLRKRLVARDSA